MALHVGNVAVGGVCPLAAFVIPCFSFQLRLYISAAGLTAAADSDGGADMVLRASSCH